MLKKTKNGRFSHKIALRLQKVCNKVSLCENCQRQSCKAFIDLTIRAKMIVGDVAFYVKIWRILTLLQKADFRSIFTRSVSAVTLAKKIQLTLIGSPLRAF